MDQEHKLNLVGKRIDDFNAETKLNLKLHVEHEMEAHRKILPRGLFYGEIHEEITAAVNKTMAQYTINTDIKPKQLYSYLQSELAADPNLSKEKLHFLAYQHMAENTNSKFLKKLFNKLKKGF